MEVSCCLKMVLSFLRWKLNHKALILHNLPSVCEVPWNTKTEIHSTKYYYEVSRLEITYPLDCQFKWLHYYAVVCDITEWKINILEKSWSFTVVLFCFFRVLRFCYIYWQGKILAQIKLTHSPCLAANSSQSSVSLCFSVAVLLFLPLNEENSFLIPWFYIWSLPKLDLLRW